VDPSIERAAERVASASRALDAGADDLKAAARRGVLVNGAGMQLEDEASRLEKLAAEVEALQAVAAG
jgi:hypothetical protein